MLRTHARLPLLALLCLIGLTSSCASGDSADSSRSLTPIAELPEAYGEAWKAWYTNSEEWPALREKVRGDPELAAFFVDNLLRVLIGNYAQASLASAGQRAGLFERSSRELIYLQEHSGPLLVELLVVGDSVSSFLAGDLLRQIGSDEWTLAVARKLENEDAEERRRAAELLGKLPPAGANEDKVWAYLTGALGDSSWVIRSQVVLTVGQRSLARGRVDLARPLLSRALSDPEPTVVRAACESLRLAEDRLATPALIQLLERLQRNADDLKSMRATQQALLAVTGEARPKSAAEWQLWWRENRR